MKWECRCGETMKTKGLDAPPREETRCPSCLSFMQPANFKRGKRIERKPKVVQPREAIEVVEIRLAKDEWWREVRDLPCAVCGGRCGVTRGHHVLYQQWLRSVARTLRIDYELLLRWDKRNRLPVGDGCHNAHHAPFNPKRIPRLVIVEHCPKVFDMAAELGHGLERRLDETYPDVPLEAAA